MVATFGAALAGAVFVAAVFAAAVFAGALLVEAAAAVFVLVVLDAAGVFIGFKSPQVEIGSSFFWT